MELVRKRLSASEIIPSNQRYNLSNNMVEYSPDGGVTWFPMPSLDPRTSPVFLLPPLGSDVRCDAAANMVKWMKDFLDGVTALLATGAEALTIANYAIPLYELISGGSLTLLAIITGIGESLFSLGYAALLAAMDSTAYDALLCCFYCHLPPDGQVNDVRFAAIQAQILTDLNTTAGIVVTALLFLQGNVGLSNAGAIGSETGDCSACDCAWCWQWLDSTNLGDWEALGWVSQEVTLPTYVGGEWVNGEVHLGVNGAGHNVTYIHLRWTFPETTEITSTYPIEPARMDLGTGWGMYANGDGTIFSGTKIFGSGGGVNLPIMADSVEILIFIVDSLASITFDETQLAGNGDNPIGENNC